MVVAHAAWEAEVVSACNDVDLKGVRTSAELPLGGCLGRCSKGGAKKNQKYNCDSESD